MGKRLCKLVSVLLILVISMTGCAGETPQTGDKTSSGAPSNSSAEEQMDTFSFSVTLNNRGADGPDTPANKAWLAKMEELMGMKIDIDWNYISASEYDDKMKILLSGGDLTDYFLLPFLYDYKPMAQEGFFLDLAKYDMTNYLSYVDQARNGRATAFMEDGTMPVVYCVTFPLVPGDRMPIFNTNAMWNYTAFEREGIKIPETLDEVYEAAKAFKAKYPNSYPVNVNYQGVFAVFSAYHVYAHLDGAATLYWDGDEYTFAGLQPQYKDGVEYLRKLYAEGLWDPEYIIDTVDTVKTKMLNEDNFMLLNAWRTQPAEYTRDSGYETKFVAAFVPDNPEYGKAWQTFSRANEVELSGWEVYAVNAETEHPDLLTKFLNLQYTPEVYEIYSWGVEGVSYTVDENGDKKFVDEFFEADDPAKVADKYGIWNDRSGRVFPGLRVIQDNLPREKSFPINDYVYFDGKYEEAPIMDSTYFKSLSWPNEYTPPYFYEPALKLTEEENTEASSILNQMRTYASQVQADLISGEQSMDTWDEYIETFKAFGYERVLEIYNAAAKRALDE